jgi:putative transposase
VSGNRQAARPEGDRHLPKDTHPTLPAGPELVLPEQVTIALGELAGAAREGLLASRWGPAWACSTVSWTPMLTGWSAPEAATTPTVLRFVMAPARQGHPGRPPGAVDHPRVRTVDGSDEVSLPAWAAFSGSDLLDQLALERMLAKLSTRRDQAGLEPVGTAVEQAATGTSKSAISRRFVAATEHALAELLAADLSGLELVALMIDGVRVAEHYCVVALAITIDGTKVPVGLAEGATENATVVGDLLAGLRDRGLDVTRPVLVIIDGAKALRRAVDDVVDHPVIQRCQLHRLRNVTDRLPDAVASTVAKRMRHAYHHPDPLLAQAELETLARELDRSHPGAAASLREGLTETLTILRLGVPPTLARTLRSTNSIESMIAICRDHATND